MKEVDPVGGKSTERAKTLSERHALDSGAKSKKSFGLSLLVHGALAAGLIGVSFYPGRAPKPQRVYSLDFAGLERLPEVELAKASVEELPLESAPPNEMEPADLDEVWNEAEVPQHSEPLPRQSPETIPAELWEDALLTPDFVGRSDVLPPLQPEVPATASEEAPALPEAPPTLPDLEPEVDIESPAPPRVEGEDPEYPRMSLRLKEEGDVELRLSLDDEGRVRGVELVKSSGHSRLDEAAMAAAPRWRFDLTPPPGFAPEDVPRKFVHIVHFKLNP